MKSAVTICVVPEMRAGPFVYHDLADGVRGAVEHRFDAVEVFAGSGRELAALDLPRVLDGTGLKVAAVGTGAGFVKHKLTLTDPDPAGRWRAVDHVRDFINEAAGLGAMVIIGSMQGRRQPGEPLDAAAGRLTDAVGDLARHAVANGVTLLIEPLNRYEGDILNRLDQARTLAEAAGPGVKILADLFHMNIEEPSVAGALTAVGPWVGHIHLADSNRGAPGSGHTDFAAVVVALRHINYDGYLSAEIFTGSPPELQIALFQSSVLKIKVDNARLRLEGGPE